MYAKNLSVALLFKDLNDAKDISKVFKKIGIHPYFYTDLKSFWEGTLQSKPSLCLVDVSMMSSEKLVLKDHPLIKKEELPTSFFYTDKTAPLLFSTFDIFHLGLIKSSSSYAGQVKSILKRFNKINTLFKKEYELNISNKQLSKKVEKLITNTEEIKEKNSYNEFLMESVDRVTQLKTSLDFEEAVSSFFKTFTNAESFSMLELSHNSQKLVASECFALKYKKIPTLWLGKTCLNGIEAFAQTLASQVVMELTSGPIISLNIEGIKDNPEKLIYLQVSDEEFLEHFDWVGLERSLSSLYSYFSNKEGTLELRRRETKNTFELVSFLDSFSYGKYPDGTVPKGFTGEDYLLIDMNLDNLVDLALTTGSKGRFYWQEFYSDFFTRLEKEAKSTFEAIPVGLRHIALLVERTDDEDFFEKIKTFAFRYPYWRYFENADMILSRSMKPIIKISPFSSNAYFELINSEGVDFTAKTKSLKAKERTYYVKGFEQGI